MSSSMSLLQSGRFARVSQNRTRRGGRLLQRASRFGTGFGDLIALFSLFATDRNVEQQAASGRLGGGLRLSGTGLERARARPPAPGPEWKKLRRDAARGTSPAGLIAVPRVAGQPARAQIFAKRALDVAVAAGALLSLAPLLLLCAAAIKLETPGPALFRQRRTGLDGRQFHIWKFRTMTVMEDGPVVIQARPDDPRVTRIGLLLRRSSIDELPQLLNVLRGEMSIVGPRPHAVAHDAYYGARIARYAHRHAVKPGITGWAQVNGLRGETRLVQQMMRRVAYDIWYVDHWSVALDLRILVMTFAMVFRADAF
jgi:putative colanic acid biosynthesis UDP-glucose lipid carrier transferase